MRLTVRSKLVAIVAVPAIALLVLVVASTLIERRVDDHLQEIRQRHIPRLGLAPRLEASFERIGRSLQDAADAGDADLVDEARQRRDTLFAEISAAGAAITPGQIAALRLAIHDYHAAAEAVSRRLIEGDAADELRAAIEAMQAKRGHAAGLLADATRLDDRELAAAFAAAADAQRTSAQIRMAMIVACMLSILILTLWIGRGLFRSIAELAAGLRRVGEGRFATPIPVVSRDELGDVARQANQMAERLHALDWLRSGHAGLVEELHGELEPEQVATRALAFLARHLEVPVGALYYTTAAGADLVMLGRYGVEDDAAIPERIARGQGVIGEAAARTEPTVIEAPDEHGLRLRTGLVELRPRAIALVPLIHDGAVRGVVELVSLGPWPAQATELMLAVREVLTTSIEVARARAATRVLLARTQHQAEELARTSAYKSKFLASMSHELRTPLNAIIGFSQLLHDGMVPASSPKHHEFLGHVLSSGKHLLQLINDVLDLSKVEAGKLDFFPEPVVLGQLLGEVVSILRATAAQKKIQIESQVDPAVANVVLDPGRLKQVLYNFLSNAIKFTPEKGRVEIRALPEGEGGLRLEVEDDGAGIAPRDLPRLFSEFEQVGERPGAQGGSGLGLALTRRLVEVQGGTVGVRSELGKGSVFHAILPGVIGATPVTRPTASRPAAAPAAAPPAEGAPTVLIIEDDPRDQLQLVDALEAAGYAVEVVGSGRAAVARCRERRFDAITLDLLLPDASGLEVLEQLRAEHHQDCPTIVVTVVAERGAVAGFAVDDVLPKPVDPDALVASLLRAGVTPSASQTVLVVDDDPASLQLMSATLREHGFHARCEADARTALDALRATPPVAVVLDLLMPEMSGFEFLDQVRRAPATRGVPVIVWTSKDLSPAEHQVLRASAGAVISKGPGGSAGVIAELNRMRR